MTEQGTLTQAEFGDLVGISQQAVSALVQAGVLEPGAPWRVWLRAYCERLREQAAGRMGAEEGLDLVQERAALARSQRIAQDLKNAVSRGEYAPIGLLTDVLALAASSVVDRFDQLDGAVRKACPELPEQARAAVQGVIASARNEWIKATAQLVDERLAQMDEQGDELEAAGEGADA